MPDVRGFSPRVNIGVSALYGRLRHLGSHERPEISGILGKMDLDLDDYFSEIATLKARVVFLKAQSDRLQKLRATLRSLLSPIHRLPNELLTRILVYACETNSISGAAPRYSTGALTIAAICYRWRALAISCAEIWSNISILLSHVHENSSSLLDLFLLRSRQHPLRLEIRSLGRMGWGEIRANPLFQRLVDSSPRWQHLSFYLSVLDPAGLPILGDIPLPSLEKASFVFYSGNATLPLHFSQITPKLHKIYSNRPIVFPVQPVPPAMDCITSLTFLPSYVSNDLVVPGPLDPFPNIQVLELLDRTEGFPRLDYSPRSIHLTSLELTLHSLVTGQDRIDLLELSMDSLTVPTLSTLIIRYLITTAGTSLKRSFPRICTFLGRSGCALTVLELRGLPVADHYVVDLFWHLHSLTHLTINDPVSNYVPDSENLTFPVTKELIKSLHAHRSSSLHPSLDPLLPKLYSLVLKVRSKGFHHSSFISTITSRWIPDQAYAAQIGVSCLRSVELHLAEPVQQDHYLALSHLERAGMRFVVKGNS